MHSLTKEMHIQLAHLFFLKLLSGISNHPERLYGVQLQTLRVQLSEDKLMLNSVVDLISVEEESVNSARGDFSNQIVFTTQSLAKQHLFTCHNCGKPDHFFHKCPYPLKKNLKSIVTGKNMSSKNEKFKKNTFNGKSKMKGQVVQCIVESSTSSSSDENANIKQVGSVLVIGDALNTSIMGKQDKDSSIFDSGASDPFFITKSALSHYVSLRNVFVKVANGELVPVTHVGEACIPVFIDGIKKELIYKKAFVIPSLDQNLLSISKLWDNGYTFGSDMKTQSLLITDATTGELICPAPEKNGVFPLCKETWHGATAFFTKHIIASSSLLWHQ